MRIKVLSGGRKSIELPLSDAELNFQMRRIGIEETVPMCRLVEVSEKDNGIYSRKMSGSKGIYTERRASLEKNAWKVL